MMSYCEISYIVMYGSLDMFTLKLILSKSSYEFKDGLYFYVDILYEDTYPNNIQTFLNDFGTTKIRKAIALDDTMRVQNLYDWLDETMENRLKPYVEALDFFQNVRKFIDCELKTYTTTYGLTLKIK